MTMAALFLCAAANAFTFTCRWNIPGAVEIKTDSYLSGPVVGPEDEEAVSFETDFSTANWTYAIAKEGYKITGATLNGSEINPVLRNGLMYVGKFLTSQSEMELTLAPIDRSSSFTVDVENGAEWIGTTLSNGEAVYLANGSNTVTYDPDLVSSCSFSPIRGVIDFYSISLNGEPLEKRYDWSSDIVVDPLHEGDIVAVRVFETEEPVVTDCTVTLLLPEGLDECVKSVLDWTYSEWLTFEDGKLTVKSDSDLGINFDTEDYLYDSFTMNGEDVTDLFRNGTLRLRIKEDCTVTVEGRAKVYDDIDFTAYVMNPEGVKFYRGWYQQNPLELNEGGEPISESITLPKLGSTVAVTMTPDNTCRFKLSLSEKRPYIYVAPQEGWYIYTVQSEVDGVMSEENILTGETTTFYVVAYPLGDTYDAKVNVIGDGPFVLQASEQRSKMWDNPDRVYDLEEGENIISFIPGYDLPLSVRSRGNNSYFSVFLDGAGVNPDDNGIYEVIPWYPADGGEADAESLITVNVGGSPLQTTRVRVETGSDISAELFYSAVRRPGILTGQVVLRGTEMILHPSSTDCKILIDGEVVNGYDDEGVMVKGLDEEGDCRFTAKGSSMTVEVFAGAAAGVENPIASGHDAVTVYSIDGQLLMENASPESLGNLDKGIYIVNGKKTIIGD